MYRIIVIKIMNMYLANAFSLQMISVFPCDIHIEEIDGINADYVCIQANTPEDHPDHIISAIGHQNTANVLGVPCNRINVSLNKGDVLFVAQLQGGRLPEGCTKLPEGFNFRFFQITIK